MRSLGIRNQVLLLAVVPTITVSILLVAYFTSSRLQDLEQNFYERGEAIALKLAQNVEVALFSRNTKALQSLVAGTLKEQDVQSIACYSEDGNEIISMGQNNIIFNPPFSKPSSFQHTAPCLSNSDSKPIKEEASQTLSIVVPIKSYQEKNMLPTKKFLYSDFSQFSQQERVIGWLKIEFDTKAIHLREYEVLINTGILLLFGLSISGLHALHMGRKVTRPILEMAEAVKKIKLGNLSIRVRNSVFYELRILESGINTMAIALENAHAELQQKIEKATGNLRRSLETIELQNLELELARQMAENANRVKSQFLANMSHEIRTPLNAVVGFIRLLKKTPLNKEQQDYIQTLQRSSHTLLSLINDILDFSKIEAGKLQIEKKPVDIRDCLEESITLHTPYANDKNLNLISQIYPDVPQIVLADPLRLKQIMNNLLNNAIKFTEKGQVTLRLQLEKNIGKDIEENTSTPLMLKLSVTDTGIGLTAEEQQKLFQPFNQASIDISQKFGGTGLGLMICKKLVEQMKGDIGVLSTPNEGSTFWFTFEAYPYSSENYLAETEEIQSSFFDKNTLEDFQKSFSNLHVLAVDDNADNLKLITLLLEELHIRVTAVLSGYAAFEAIKSNHDNFDLILMDIRMPEFDGIQTTKAIREFETEKAYSPIPIIALTAHAFISEREALLTAGIDDYLIKPLEEPKLLVLLEKWGNKKLPHSLQTDLHALSSDNKAQGLKIIDYELGLKLAGQKEDLAQELFEKLIEDLPKQHINMAHAFQKQDWNELRDVAHRLHGACCYCGVPALKQAVKILEQATATKTKSIIESKLNLCLKAIADVLGVGVRSGI